MKNKMFSWLIDARWFIDKDEMKKDRKWKKTRKIVMKNAIDTSK